ncbi:MAG: hypothetical protein WC236_15450 [Gallionellaceae bacterium]
MQKLDSDFICCTSLPCLSASVLFLGPFQGQTVLWQMNLATLAHFRLSASNNSSPLSPELIFRPFIEIQGGDRGVMQLAVGLELEAIDEPVIKKTIIMMRNYKRLALGRIEFGSMHT